MSQLSDKDREIVEALRGDQTAYRSALKDLMKSCRGKVIYYIRQKGGTEEDAKDIFQESLIVLIKNVRAGKFAAKSSLETYLFGISKRLFTHQITRKKAVVSIDEIKEPLNTDSHYDELMYSDLSKERILFFQKLVDKLDEGCRNYFIDMALGYSLEVHANRAGIKYQSAKNISAKCQKRLRDLLLEPSIQKRLKEL